MKSTSPTQDQISQRARELWTTQGKPSGRDHEIWLEAERQLSKPTAAANVPSATEGRGNSQTQASKTPADPKASDLKKPTTLPGGKASKTPSGESERLRGEMASESQIENQISPALSDDEEIKAALQKKEARAPKVPHTNAPHAKPPESGKPIWDKPHSS